MDDTMRNDGSIEFACGPNGERLTLRYELTMPICGSEEDEGLMESWRKLARDLEARTTEAVKDAGLFVMTIYGGSCKAEFHEMDVNAASQLNSAITLAEGLEAAC